MRLRAVAVLVATLVTLTVYAQPADPVGADTWKAALAAAAEERKPIVVFERPARCKECDAFERKALTHPVIERRLNGVVFIVQRGDAPALTLFDRAGRERAAWSGVPKEPAAFAAILDTILSVAPNLERAVTLGPIEGEIEMAIALAALGRREDARAALDRAIAHGSPKTRQLGLVARAMLLIGDQETDEALQILEGVVAEAVEPEVAATALVGVGNAQRIRGAAAEAIRAYTKALELAPAGSPAHVAATATLEELKESEKIRAVRLVPIDETLVTGRQTIRTSVASANVARVVFTIDGAEQLAVDRPPFSATVDFGRIPQTRIIRAVAYDPDGRELGRDELTVNHAGELFWLRLLEPREGPAEGNVRATTTMRTPAGHEVKRVVISWNDAERAVIGASPWQAVVAIPRGETGVLRAVAELDDGRTAEDAVLLNAPGYAERADVPRVELAITISGTVAPDELSIREGNARRRVESITSGAEAPLTVGMVIDSSGSMMANILNAQEAAIRFLETTLGERDRAFLVTFAGTSRLVRPPTSDVARLREQIMAIKPSGATALFDAVILGLLQFEGVKGRRALVVFSDGADTSSRYRLADVEELARRSNIPIYFIAAAPPASLLPSTPYPSMTRPQPPFTVPAPGAPAPPSPPPLPTPMGNRDAYVWDVLLEKMRRIGRATGGNAHVLKDLDELPEVYRQIEQALRAQTLVVIATDAGKSEHDWRKIKVNVEGRRLHVRAPEGYYAPW